MKLIILDRDGVINYDSVKYIKSPREWIPIPGSLDAIAKLTQAGYTLVVATNQSGIARKLYSTGTLEKIHDKMHELVTNAGGRIAKIFFCPHHPDENCECRKPKPGLLLQIATHYKIDLRGIPFVGDSLRDLLAAEAVGCQPILLKPESVPLDLTQHPQFKNVPVFNDLREAVDEFLKKGKWA